MSRSIHPRKIEVKEVPFDITFADWKAMSCCQQAKLAANIFDAALSSLPYEKDRFRVGKLALSTQSAPFVHCTLERGGCLTAVYCIARFREEVVTNDQEPNSVSFDERTAEI